MIRLLTSRELSAHIALAPQTIHNRRAAGNDLPPAIVLGRRARFKLSDVHQWMEHHKEERAAIPATATREGGNA
ncbi:helix-turn-helix domain-containing protein [Oryzisolibacter sp. LB2S]|uniref:helix-turn-helix transcriptional regulator n=1 Tax=Alicycliphilus soli TaxID=3228789 RepID=UPI00345AD9DC